MYAIRALLRSLAPVIGAEEEFGHAVKEGWATAVNGSQSQIAKWREAGLKHSETIEQDLMSVFIEEYYCLMRKVNFLVLLHS